MEVLCLLFEVIVLAAKVEGGWCFRCSSGRTL